MGLNASVESMVFYKRKRVLSHLSDFIILAFSNVSLLEHFFAEFGFCFGYGVKVRNHLGNEIWVLLHSVTRFIDAQFGNLLYWIDYCAHLLLNVLLQSILLVFS